MLLWFAFQRISSGQICSIVSRRCRTPASLRSEQETLVKAVAALVGRFFAAQIWWRRLDKRRRGSVYVRRSNAGGRGVRLDWQLRRGCQPRSRQLADGFSEIDRRLITGGGGRRRHTIIATRASVTLVTAQSIECGRATLMVASWFQRSANVWGSHHRRWRSHGEYRRQS